MPLTRIACCDDLYSLEEIVEHVSGRDNKCQWTTELVVALLETSVAHPSHEDPTRISTTVLTSKCLRQVALERSTDFITTLDAMWASFRGTMFHGQLEKFARPPSYGEARFYVKDLGRQIPAVKKALPGKKDRSFSGSPDLVDPVAGGLYDYKRTKEVPRWNTCWPDHIVQNNINRWLVDNADFVEIADDPEKYISRLDGEEYDVEPGHYPGFLNFNFKTNRAMWDLSNPAVRERFVPDEWTSLVIVYVDDKGPKPIEVTKSIQVPKVSGNGTKAARVADIWSDEQVEEYIAEKYPLARAALTEHLAPIPEGWEFQSHVLCGFCPLKNKCAALEREGK